LLDMVSSMLSLIDLPQSFWGYALETAAFTKFWNVNFLNFGMLIIN